MVETLVEVRKTMTATAEGFALQASVMLEPWRARQRVVSLHAKSLAASSDDALRAVVKERASKKELSPEDVWHLMGSSSYLISQRYRRARVPDHRHPRNVY